MGIENVDLIETKVGRWSPSDLAFIEELAFHTEYGKQASSLSLICLFQRRDIVVQGWPSKQLDYYRIHLRFEGIRDLFLSGFGTTPKQIMGFDIVDISDRGWQEINFQIEDYEQNQIGFLCRSIGVQSVENVNNLHK